MTKHFISDGVGYIELIESLGNDLTIVNTARVSFNKESKEVSDQDVRLIKYLAKNDHISPFFHPIIRLRVKMPIFLIRQWYKHSIGFARNEVSRRYVDSPPELWTPQGDLRKRHISAKQGSSDELIDDVEEVEKRIILHNENSLSFYNYLLEKGVCPELARTQLSMCLYTEFIETASLAGYARLYKLRSKENAQKEIREYAELINKILSSLFPVSWQELTKSKGKL